jgi:hypothetical protein
MDMIGVVGARAGYCPGERGDSGPLPRGAFHHPGTGDHRADSASPHLLSSVRPPPARAVCLAVVTGYGSPLFCSSGPAMPEL